MREVLVADDDGPLSALLTERLKSLGLKVTLAHDAAHALFLMQRNPPDLVITDVRMPAGNGLAVCEMMRDDARLASVPVIIMTGHSAEDYRRRAASMGAHYVRKGDGLWDRIRPLCASILGIKTE